MATRGLIGFRYDDIDKLVYNHSDSDPDILGLGMLRDLRGVKDWSKIESRIGKLKALPETNKPGCNDGLLYAEMRRHFPNLEPATHAADYHGLFKPLQGSVKPYLDGRLSYLPDASDFIHDSLHCDWAYIANLDDWKYEIWKGNQTKPDPDNRYGQDENRMGYFPCSMVKAYELEDLPEPGRYLSDYYLFQNLAQARDDASRR